MSMGVAALVDASAGIGVLALTSFAFFIQPYSQVGFEYLHLVAPALLFPAATAFRARAGRLPRWATLLLVNVWIPVGVFVLAKLSGGSARSLLPVSGLILAGSALAAL